MNFYPVKDKLLISYEEGENKTAGGIIIPDVAKTKLQTGIVMRVGGGVKLYNQNSYRVGDRVLFDRYSGVEIIVNDIKYLLIKEDDVLGYFAKAAVEVNA